MEFLASLSVDKRPEHLAYVGTVLPIEHPWWDDHLPPIAWNCKCRVRPTDKEPTAVPEDTPIDAPGCVLAGGDVNESGSVVKSFGKYKNKMYENMPRTNFNVNTHYYTIYHSIGNTNYIPIVTNRSPAWADVPRVMSTNSYSFTIAFFNQENKVSEWRQPFTYVCYKAD